MKPFKWILNFIHNHLKVMSNHPFNSFKSEDFVTIKKVNQDRGDYCQKGVPGCLCKVGFPPEFQCPLCREDKVRDSRCICSYKFYPEEDEFFTKLHNKERNMWWFFNNKPNFKKYDWTHVVIHHSQSSDHNETAQMNDLRKWHMKENGWDYIGYHFVIDRIQDTYEIIQGRPLNMNGAHTAEDNMNYRGIGICVIGNFNKEVMPEEAQQKLAILIKSLQVQFDISDNNVKMHRDYTYTKTCPGTHFDLNEWKRDYLDQV